MPLLPITAIYASLLGLLVVFLAIRVVRARRRNKVGLGTGGNRDVEHAMRVHANVVEYAPIALLLIAMLELNQAANWALHTLGAVLLIARVLHAQGFASGIGVSFGRVAGTATTWGVIIVAGAGNLFLAFR